MSSETVTLHDGVECDSDDAVYVSEHDAYYPADECVELADGTFLPESEATKCYDDQWWPSENCVQLSNGDWSSENDDNIVMLHNRDFALADDAVMVDGEYYDPDDVTSCESCSDSILSDDATSAPGGGQLCQSCYDDQVCNCEGCNQDIWRDDANFTHGDPYCDDCHRAGQSDLVVCYTDKSSVRMPSPTPRALRTIGIELEVESRTNQHAAAEFARDHLPDDYCSFKEDGSLDDNGFEIVTRWDSAAVHVEKFNEFFAHDPHRKMTSWRTGNCGMHVHVAKASLTPLQIGKMMCFINATANKQMVVHVAGRESGYAELTPKKVSDALKPDYRRSSLNVTDFSAEFRIFRGTLKPAGFFRNLEFVQAVVRFCEPAARSIDQSTSAEEFCRWLPKSDYSLLHEHLVRGGFIPGEAKPERIGDE
jgi:hypothetical protein